MFKTTKTDNSSECVCIQGAYSQNSNSDIASVMFQNYDADTRTVYNMASIGMIDNYGTSNQNGFGDIVFRTNNDGSSNLVEQMRILYNGNVGIGTKYPNYKLDVNGNVNILGSLYNNSQPVISFNNLQKTCLSSSNISMNISWSNINYSNHDLFIVAETIQEISYNGLPGYRTQRHTINTCYPITIIGGMVNGQGNINRYTSALVNYEVVSSNSVMFASIVTDPLCKYHSFVMNLILTNTSPISIT